MANDTPNIRIYNSLSRKKEPLQPLRPGHLGLYACGVTVYDDCHLGHGLQALVFDVISRYLRFRGFDVTYVRNYTDVDDKIIARAKERGVSPLTLSAEMIAREAAVLAALGVLPPTHTPKVSEYIPNIVQFIKTLVENGAAYATPRGNVYYRVRAKEDYGKLSGRKIGDLRVGVRKDVEDDKEDPLDFALWKAEEEEGATWPSPFGNGRPGWHIECSVMSHELLGEPFDLHGGGLDLIFPHHENEIAQSESYCGHQHVQVWIHNGLLTVNKEKMSKSLGNFYTIDEALKKFGAELIRFSLLQAHYRKNADFNAQLMATNAGRLANMFDVLLRIEERSAAHREAGEELDLDPNSFPPALLAHVAAEVERVHSAFTTAMDDDFGAPSALVAIADGVRTIDESLRRKKTGEIDRTRAAIWIWAQLKPLAEVLGVLQQPPAQFFAELKQRFLKFDELDEAWIAERMERRLAARTAKDFAASDAIRDELLSRGVLLRDAPTGTDWMVAKEALERIYG